MSFTDFKNLIASTASRYGYSAALMAAQVAAESRFNPGAVSPTGAQGLSQFEPSTWSEWGHGGDPFDPAANLDANARYMSWLLGQFSGAASQTELALAAYNWGIGHVKNLVARTGRSDWAYLAPMTPAETQGYVTRIMDNLSSYKAAFGIALGSAGLLIVGVAVLLGWTLLRRIV